MVNKFHYVRGGAERYVFDLTALLERHGHEVIHLSTRDTRNRATRGAAEFIPGVDFDQPGGLAGALRTGARVIYSRLARRAMAGILDRHRPDLVHLHNIAHHFSPSILLELGKRDVPVVQTLHDYKLACPTYLMLCHGEICERCASGRFVNAFLKRCNRGSLSRSAVSAIEGYLHSFLRSYHHVDRFLCPSRFLLERMSGLGIDSDRFVHLPLFMDAPAIDESTESGSYAVFVGRLAGEKGIHTLIEAARLAPGLEIVVVGDGPERETLEKAIDGGLENLRCTGYLEGESLRRVWRGAAFTVMPSEWYENFPMTVLESLALGKPVIASRLGAIPEMVEDGVTGVLVPPGDPAALAAAMQTWSADRVRLEDLGRAARARVVDLWGAERHYRNLITVYKDALACHPRAAGTAVS